MWLKVRDCSIPHIESPGVFYDTTQEITLNLAQIILIYYEPMQSVTISYCQKRASRVCSNPPLFFFFSFYEMFCRLIQNIPGAKQKTWFCCAKGTDRRGFFNPFTEVVLLSLCYYAPSVWWSLWSSSGLAPIGLCASHVEGPRTEHSTEQQI